MKSFKWIKYALIGFILIAIYNANHGYIKDIATKTTRVIKSLDTPTETENTTIKEKKSTKEKLTFSVKEEDQDSMISKITVNFINKILDNPHGRIIFEDLVNKMVNNYHRTIGDDIIHKEYIAKDILVGSGQTASCGDQVEITYNLKNASDKDESNYERIKKSVFIGNSAINKNLENGLIGMREHGERKIMYNDNKSPLSNNKNKKNSIVADVTLEKIIRKNSTPAEWGIFIDKNSFSLIGPKIMCGDTVKAYYAVRTLQGTKIYNSKEYKKTITFKIGDKKTPSKISNGFMGLVKNESKISLFMEPKELSYKDTSGTKLVPREIQIKGPLIIELDTKI